MACGSVFNQMPTDNEETIRYWLFPHLEDGTLMTDLEALEDLAAKLLAHVAVYTHQYIWNNESFTLKVKKEAPYDGTSGVLGPHIAGITVVGDYLEDEWFIVFLLLTLTKDFPELVCRVIDSDGEFLLIEAANHLPSWANPDSAEQRVYLSKGHVHLIPLASSPASLTPLPSGTPSVMDAVSTVRRLPEHTRASPQVQAAVTAKVDGYPGKISREQHVAHVYVPVGVAALLREYPTLVAPAVHAFCRRDVIDNKALRVMRHFPPETRVMTACRFSKALYAQLASQRYSPDVRTGWELPPPAQSEFKQHDIGMKLACGFELLVCSAGGVTPVSTPSDPPGSDASAQLDLANNPRWLKYKQSLSNKGYFRGELEGSKLFKELEDRARQFFVTNMVSSKGSEESEDMLSAGAIIIKLLGKVNVDYEFYKERATRLVHADDDSWLQITPDALDDMLENKFESANGNDQPRPADDTEVMNSLSAFLGHMSDLDGAEVPQDLQERIRKLSTLSTSRKASKARKPSSLMVHPQVRKISAQSNASDSSNSSEMSSLSNKVDFNAESFTEAITNILEFGVPEDDYWNQSEDESSGMSSYGEEDAGDGSLSRKSSNTSQKSAASTVSATSSGVDLQMREYLREMERELAATTLRDSLASQPYGNDDEADDEFDDVEDFEPVKVDMQAVQDLVKTYTAQNGLPGPASSLLGSVGIKPEKK
ncbi:protein ecdysoneless homolog [Penaeus monodon]|uniref:protein ecdysoneless homolog n=1 Tax=Penaeus monodon TaxID=6687 RepID=UPI0018A78E0E|nr:protein ecdysoneless homolog [Penaeus monodon]